MMKQVGEETKEEGQAVNNQDKPTEEVEIGQENAKGKAKSRSGNRNKQVDCKVCHRKMRSDAFKRHMFTHQKIITLEEDEMREEIRRRKQERDTGEERRRIARRIADEEGISLEDCGLDVSNNTLNQGREEDLEEIMLKNNQSYQEMIERGKRITGIIRKGTVCEGSLSREHKHALDLYRKERSLQFFLKLNSNHGIES